MAPSRRKGASKAAAAAAAARRQWKVGDLVLAKVKGFPAWPATVSEPEKWGYSSDWKKVLVYFFGTKQIAFCNPADVEEFTEEKKQSLLGKRHGRSSDFVRAVQEIIDCYDKLKESNRVDQPNSGEALAENVAVVSLNANDNEVRDTTNGSRVKSSNSSRPKDEPSIAVEDVGALTEVDSLPKTDVSEEPAHNAASVSMPMPNTYTLRKKSRSVQPQRCASKKKVSVQRSRSSSGVDSHGLQNGVVKSGEARSSGEGGINGFWDGTFRRAKRSKRSPDGPVPNVGDSPVCNSNGTVEDNGSEIAMAESETLSNNEGSAIESNHRRDQSEVLNESCEGGLELRNRLDLPVSTAVVRKKRNPGRRRALNDGVEAISRVDQEAIVDKGVHKDTLELPSLCMNINSSHSKDEGDEHLPLVKRARVRMGKLLTEQQQQQLDLLVNGEEKSLEALPASSSLEVSTSLNFGDVNSLKNVMIVDESIARSPADGCTQLQENKPQNQIVDLVFADDQVGCSAVDNCVQVPDNRSEPMKSKGSQPFGCGFDGEAALPPSKRLHRAFEAMSANAAEENQTSVEVFATVSPRTDKGSHRPQVDSYFNKHVEDAVNSLELQNEPLTCNSALNDKSSGVPDCSSLPRCEIFTKASGDVAMVDSSARCLDLWGEFVREDTEVLALSDNEDVNGAVGTNICSSVLQEKALHATANTVGDSEHMLGSMTSTQNWLPFEESCEAEEELQPIDKSNCLVPSERDTKPISGVDDAADVGCHVGTTVNLSDKETDCCTSTQLKTLADEKDKASIFEPVEEVKHTSNDASREVSCSPSLHVCSLQRTCDGASVSGDPSHDQPDANLAAKIFPAEVDVGKHVSHPNGPRTPSDNNHNFRHDECIATDTKLYHTKHVSDESKSLDAGGIHQSQSGERVNLAEVKAAIASLELTLGSLTRTKESIGRATRIALDCVKFGVAADVVELIVLYLEKESSLHKRVDLFFLVDSIAQHSRGLKDEVGTTYVSAVKETLARMLAAAAPAGHAGRENRRQCLKVLRLWLDRRILPDSIILQHIRELESQNCSTSGYSRRMSRTERSFDDPLRDMEGMLVDEYGSNSSFQLPGFCMPPMLKEEDDGSDSDGGSFEAVTPEHASGNKEIYEATALPATGKHRHILEEVDGELEMEDVAPCEVELGATAASTDNTALNTQHSGEQFTSFIPPLPHEVPPRAPPLPSSPPPPPPPPPPSVSHASTVSHVNVDSQLHVNRNSVQETMAPRPLAPGIHHPMPMAESTSSCSYNSYAVMHNPVPPGNSVQPADANLYGKHYNIRPPYPSSSNQFSYFQADQQIRPQREIPPRPYYDRPHFGQKMEGGHYYGDQDNIRRPRHEVADGWGYSRPPFHGSMHPENEKGCPPMYSGMSCERNRPPNHGWGFPPLPAHHRNHIPSRPSCDGGVPVGVRAPGYWRPR